LLVSGTTHPQTISFGREEGIEELFEVIRRSPDTRVLHADEDAGAVLSLTTFARDDKVVRPSESPCRRYRAQTLRFIPCPACSRQVRVTVHL